MIPLEFMDGSSSGTGTRPPVGMAGVTAFLLARPPEHEDSYFSALQETTPLTAVLLIGICSGVDPPRRSGLLQAAPTPAAISPSGALHRTEFDNFRHRWYLFLAP